MSHSDTIRALVAGLGASADSLGNSMQARSAEDRAARRALEQLRQRKELEAADDPVWGPLTPGEDESGPGLFQQNKRTGEVRRAQTSVAGLKDTIPTTPKIATPATPAPRSLKPYTKPHGRELRKNDQGYMVSVDPETGLGPDGHPVKGYTPPKEPGLVAVPVDDGEGRTKTVLVPKVAGQEVPGPNTRTPAAIQTAVAKNKSQLALIADAQRELDQHPDAVGLRRGIGEMVPLLGGVQDQINQRQDPGGVAARAQLGNIGSLIIHDRSGAAVTISEFPRLKPFIPTAADTPAAIRIKLQKLAEQIGIETQAMQSSSSPAVAAPSSAAPPTRRLGTSKPALADRVRELKASGVGKDQAKAILRAEGYEVP